MTRPQLSIGQRGCEGINTQCYDDGICKSQSYVKLLFSEDMLEAIKFLVEWRSW